MVHGSWFMVHGTQTTECCPIQIPRSSWNYRSDHLEPWFMVHGAIPWVLLALDPGAWFMVHEPIPWVLVAPGSWFPGSWFPGSWYILRSR